MRFSEQNDHETKFMSLLNFFSKKTTNPFENEANKMSRQALQTLLDAAAKKDNKIDGVFVVLPNSGNQITMQSQVAGFAGDPKVAGFIGWIGRFSNIGNTLDNLGYGKPKYAAFPMEDAILLLFFENEGFTQPVIIGFFCLQKSEAEKALGEMVYHAKNYVYGYESNGRHIEGIKEMLTKIL